jgi:hypothetical protein
MDQPFAHNLLVTGIVARLALYPIPLLRTFLLDLSFSKEFSLESPSLFDVINELILQAKVVEQEEGYAALRQEKIGVHTYAPPIPDAHIDLSAISAIRGASYRHEALIADSSLSVSSSMWDTVLNQRAGDRSRPGHGRASPPLSEVSVSRREHHRNRPPSPTMSEVSQADSILTVQDSGKSRYSGFMSWINPYSRSAQASEAREIKQSAIQPQLSPPQAAAIAEDALEKNRKKKLQKSVMGVIVLDEFLKELAAICLEHAAFLPV